MTTKRITVELTLNEARAARLACRHYIPVRSRPSHRDRLAQRRAEKKILAAWKARP